VIYQVVWSSFASSQLEDVFDYYSQISQNVAKQIILQILSDTEKLKLNANLGQMEELLANRKTAYRYLISGNYRIIYTIKSEHNSILIADVFDSRQNPVKISRSK